MRNAPRYLRHTGVLNTATEVALSFPSDGKDQPRCLQVSKAKQDLSWKPFVLCVADLPLGISAQLSRTFDMWRVSQVSEGTKS